jgi:hypothetical protein
MGTTNSELTFDDPEARLYPRLTRFYGLGYRELRGMPRPVIRRYLDELPRLRAEEQLLALQVAAGPHLEEGGYEDLVEHWERYLEDETAEPATAAAPHELANIGIRLVVEGGE